MLNSSFPGGTVTLLRHGERQDYNTEIYNVCQGTKFGFLVREVQLKHPDRCGFPHGIFKWDEIRNKQFLEAITSIDCSFEEILEFIKSHSAQK